MMTSKKMMELKVSIIKEVISWDLPRKCLSGGQRNGEGKVKLIYNYHLFCSFFQYLNNINKSIKIKKPILKNVNR